MNDRTSAAPPADFLGPGAGPEATTDYERHFAMDWKPPELNFGKNGGGGGGSAYGNGNGNGARNSTSIPVSSGVSGLTARTNSSKAPRPSNGSGFFAQVKEKFLLHRSTSNMSVGAGQRDVADEDVDVDVDVDADLDVDGDVGLGVDTDDHANTTTNNNGSTSSFFIPPVFKNKRSGSASTTNTQRRRGRPEWGLSKKDADDTRSMKSAKTAPPPPAFDSLPPIPSFDPTGRPSRDEIAANYQSLLASGFFGTHAIQSTRFSPPGSNSHRQNKENMPSFVQRLVEEDETSSLGNRTLPPSPDRPPPPPPPPPPPNRAAPEPPPAAMETEDSAPTSAAIPASDTVISHPATSGQTSSQAMDTDATMPPPPDRMPSRTIDPPTSMPPPATPAKKLNPTHKASLSFSSVPYSSTRPGAEPMKSAQRPYQPPPVSLSRFSFSSGRPRSFDLSQRGTKRPFTATHANSSQASFMSGTDNDYYDPMEEDRGGGIGVATTTDDGGQVNAESGARRLVKRLRKSASKISIDLGRTISRQNPARFPDGDEDLTGSGLEPTPSRTSTSSTIRRTFSWRGLGTNPGGASGPADSHRLPFSSTTATTTSGAGNFFGASDGCLPLSNNNSSSDHAAASATVPPAHEAAIPAVPAVTVPIGSGGNNSAERNRLKKREIRGRRMRRKESVKSSPGAPSPLKQAPMVLSPAPGTTIFDNNDTTTNTGMDWQGSTNAKPRGNQSLGQSQSRSRSRSRSRPRRSNASISLHTQQSQSASEGGGGGDGTTHFGGDGHNDPAPADGGMEGVEFSFHFPGRTRPGGPLAVVPDVNRGIPAVPSIPGMFRKGLHGHGRGSVRVVRSTDMA